MSSPPATLGGADRRRRVALGVLAALGALVAFALFLAPCGLVACGVVAAVDDAVDGAALSAVVAPPAAPTDKLSAAPSDKPSATAAPSAKPAADEPRSLRFPYGRCWRRSGEKCSRPFRWVELKGDELELELSPFELATLRNNTCRVADASSGFPTICCPGSQCTHYACVPGRLVNNCKWHDVSANPSGRKSMRYELAFRPWPNPRPLFSLADALALLPQGSRMTFVGDSTGIQFFFMGLCDLARSGQVSNVTLLQNVVVGRRRHDEVNVTLSGGLGTRRLAYFREPTFLIADPDRLVAQICSDVDVLVFNTGLWFNWEDAAPKKAAKRRQGNHTELVRVAGELAAAMDLHCAGVIKIFRGTLTQHFGDSLTGEWSPNTDGRAALMKTLDRKDEGECKPRPWDDDRYSQLTVAAHESAEQRYDWRNFFVVDAFARAGYNVMFTPWGREHLSGCANNTRHTLHYIPIGEVTADRFDLHPGGDCTHMCSSPSAMLVVTDAIYLAVRQVRL